MSGKIFIAILFALSVNSTIAVNDSTTATSNDSTTATSNDSTTATSNDSTTATSNDSIIIDSLDRKASLVYKFDIKEQIAPPIWHKASKAFREAKALKADYIVIHMNTYGGTLEAADSLRTKILNTHIPVFVFIDNNAASAGALISIACDSIYMKAGANIGAATVVNQSGEAMPDKYQSYMRSMMRSTAEAKGRDPEIAQAMVDPRIFIEGISDTGRVLTFTATEALKNNFCEGIVENIPDLLEKAGVKDYEIKELEITGTDKIIGFLINPFVSGILIMIIIGGIYFELQTPGIGFPILASVVAALLYFAPLYLEGLADNWEIIIFVVGVILIALEVFAIPGFGVAGISGIVLVVTGLTLSLVGNVGFDFSGVEMGGLLTAFFIVTIAIFLSLVLSFYLGKKILTTHAFGHLALETEQKAEEGYTTSDKTYKSMIGKKGQAMTMLRPSGKVEIDDEVYDATSITSFIDKGESIIVADYHTGQLFVRKPRGSELSDT